MRIIVVDMCCGLKKLLIVMYVVNCAVTSMQFGFGICTYNNLIFYVN